MRVFEEYKDIIDWIEIGRGILGAVPKWLKENGCKRILVVSDDNTRKAAGESLIEMLIQAGFDPAEYVFRKKVLKPDEESVSALGTAIKADCDMIVAVGSGVINDLCKYAGFKAGKPYVIVGTAPSMDGYAAKGAAMIINGMKVTPQTKCPKAIFCDIDIMKDAPLKMFASGLGDMLGKFNALADWRLSHLLTGEPIPEELYKMMERAVNLCAESAAKLPERDIEAVTAITEGLILSGLAMSIYGDSRPASGTEHHLAHYWEMRDLAEHREHEPHGINVGVAAVQALKLWAALPKRPSVPKPENRERTLRLVREKYGSAADSIIGKPNPNLPFSLILEKWPEVLSIAESLPKPGDLADILRSGGAPVSPDEIGVSEDLVRESILLARERKKVYTVLQLMGDIGTLYQYQVN